jgi:hypothetical protein
VAKSKLSLWSLFLFNIKYSHSVAGFYLGYTFGIDLHARKISFCKVDNQYKEGVSAFPQPKALWPNNQKYIAAWSTIMAIPLRGLRDSYKILTRFYSRKNIVESAR